MTAKPRPRRTLRSFSIPGFWRIWSGSMFWYSARWMDAFVLQWYVLLATGSPFQVSLIGFYRMAPLLLIGLVSGVAADRFERRKVLVFAQAWNGLASACIAGLLLSNRLELWHLAILVPALGVGWALDLPSRRAFIYEITGPRRLVNALALENVGMEGARMAGPIAAGLLWPIVGAAGCFVVLTAGYAMNCWLYAGLPPSAPAPTAGSKSSRPGFAEGLRYVLGEPVILGVLAVTVAANYLGFPYQNLTPVIAKQALGLGPTLAGLLVSAEGIGATVGALVLASRREIAYKGRIFAGGIAAMMAAAVGFSFSSSYPLSFGLLLLSGAGIACFSTLQSSLILLGASDGMRGRAMGALILAIGFQPLGAIQIGAVASAIGAPTAVALTTATGLLGLALIVWKTPALREFRSGR